MAPKTPPIAPPTTAVCCLSFLHTSWAMPADALNGAPVAIAVASTCCDDVGEGVDSETGRTATVDMVTLVAVELLQQDLRSLAARQQYLPKSHC